MENTTKISIFHGFSTVFPFSIMFRGKKIDSKKKILEKRGVVFPCEGKFHEKRFRVKH
jgi:hypothetical protein